MTSIIILVNRLDNDPDLKDVYAVKHTAKVMLDAGQLRPDVYQMTIARADEVEKQIKSKKKDGSN